MSVAIQDRPRSLDEATDRPRVALVLTVLNEAESLVPLLESILAQTRRPDEIVVVDGGSRDDTVEVLARYAARLPLRTLVRPGAGISRGRNEAIRAASAPIVAVTDGGVRLEPAWLERLVEPFERPGPPDVVSGFFRSDPQSDFELALGATTLPDVEDVRPERFLPSSRSVAFTRAAWERVGGYPEWLDYCEDLVFDLALRRVGCAFHFEPRAIARFRPRSSLSAFARQYYRYARGDGKALLWTKRHAVRYTTYAIAGAIALAARRRPGLLLLLLPGGLAYCRRPAQRVLAEAPGSATRRAALLAHIPLVRLVGDLAKMAGYPVGLWWRLRHNRALRNSV
jgi:glycosyltransferase involved in cell wall biosynthesis